MPAESQPVGDFSNTPATSQTATRDTTQDTTQTTTQDVLPSPVLGPYDNIESRAGQQQSRSSQSIISHAGRTQAQPYHPQQHGAGQAIPESFDMNPLGTALHDMSYQAYNQVAPQRYPPGASSSALLYQNVPPFPGPTNISPSMSTGQYNILYQGQHQGMYAQGHMPPTQHLQTMTNTGNQFYHSQAPKGQQQQPGSPYFLQNSQFSPQSQMYYGSPSPAQYGQRGSFSGDNRSSSQQRSNEYTGGMSSGAGMGRSDSVSSNTAKSSVVRGPPRKPHQSGHAIWIGNLPPQTDLMSLVRHVCQETSGLESLFLISKSNCAFANFGNEASCAAAQKKIHDSRFQTVRLVSRLRRSSAVAPAGAPVPSRPTEEMPPRPLSGPTRTPSPYAKAQGEEAIGETDAPKQNTENQVPSDKFFVVKSLTVEDLELSVRNGIWATQSHNEEALNNAYQTVGNVYLIFSANKSGEYFGYARMISPINDDPAAAIEFAPKAQAIEDPELPKAIPTPATEFVPKGRIIDDSARGTIFWEAERDEAEGADQEEEVQSSSRSDLDQELPSHPEKSWGKPFKIEWLSTTRLSFYRTRGLRNPWNSNREVKIARDGTELETSVGRRLLALFHPMQSPVPRLTSAASNSGNTATDAPISPKLL